MSILPYERDRRWVPGTRVPCWVFSTGENLARHAAHRVAEMIRQCNAQGRPAVLGLIAGSTVVGVYRELIRLYQEEALDFSRVITFNLDEYYGLEPHRLQSHHRWMREHLWAHVNIPRENVHIPDGTAHEEAVGQDCQRYESQILAAGGIDLMLLEVGSNGRVGFNEPFSEPKGRTRLRTLDPATRRAAAGVFFGETNVPTQAISMGMGTILEARHVLLMALGEHKAKVVRNLAEDAVSPRCPASLLQSHPDATVLVDPAAASDLTAEATPWVLGPVSWPKERIKRAVLWLCEQTGKALLKLDDGDFRDNQLHQLLRQHGPAQRLAHRVFRWMMNTIEYHPGGKQPRRVLCFSPHPDDDVISMGGTLIRLVEDDHEVHIAYMTSGNIAVFDHDAQRIANMVTEYNRLFGIDCDKSEAVEKAVLDAVTRKTPGDPDAASVLKIKSLIRWSEAKAAAWEVGVGEENLHFLDLPFYHTGTVIKHPLSGEDIRLVRQFIERLAPEQIYMAGDLSDPHGTHRVCAEAICQALDQIREDGGTVPEVLLYRGAWQEYALDEIEIAVPLSPRDLMLKRSAIFMHESQKDEALFPGSDPREFWERAEDRNQETANRYNRIGLPEYYAMEAFIRWSGLPL